MIGFIVENMDISGNILIINGLLKDDFKQSNTTEHIVRGNFIEDYPYHYYSIHKDVDNNALKIYHLMFDLHENIQS